MWIEVGIGEYMRKIFSYKREKIVFIVHNTGAVTEKKLINGVFMGLNK